MDNNQGEGYCAPACCCVRYSTPGTKQGDWYLPSVGELYQIYANKTVIYEKRKTLVGSGFNERSDYWSSREYLSYYEYCVSLNSGNFDSYYKKVSRYVLAFLSLEV